jgi:hypothetical protein
MITPSNRPRRRQRLVNLKAPARGANQGAPMSDHINVYPFPFNGLFKPARHGHYPVFGVGLARRVGAWRAAGPGTLGGRHQRSGRFQ